MRCAAWAARYLEETRPLPVHSVYRRTVNVYAGERILALHPQEILLTPLSAAVPLSEEAFAQFSAQVSQAGAVTPGGGCLRAGDAVWEVGPPQPWETQLRTRLTAPARRRLLDALRPALQKAGPKTGGLSDAAFCLEPQPGDPLPTKALREILRTTWVAPSPADRVASACGMIGLGGGLTPSGDDCLVGMLLAFAAAGQDERFTQLAAGVQKAAARTNDISRAYLLCACRREFGEALHQLLYAAQEAQPLRGPVAAALRVGHSSGLDTLNGLAFGLRLLEKEQEGKKIWIS